MPATWSAYRIFKAATVTGTNVSKSRVIARASEYPGGDVTACFEKTNTGTGALTLEVNNMPDDEYENIINVTAGADRDTREATNTLGWQPRDMSPTATMAFGSTDPTKNNVKLSRFRFRRCRFSYTNATGTSVIDGWFSGG